MWFDDDLREILQREHVLDPFTPISDQNRISPYIINAIVGRQVMRFKNSKKYQLEDY